MDAITTILIIKVFILLAIFAHASENAITATEKRISHNWEFAHIAAIIAAMYLAGMNGLIYTALSYIPLRMAMFGPLFGHMTVRDYTRLSNKGYDKAMQWLLKIEKRKDIKFPAYTIWIFFWLFIGLFLDVALMAKM